MMKVLISGCNGAMGQVLTKVIEEIQDMETVAGIDINPDRNNNNYPVYSKISSFKEKADVIIDFSNPNCIDLLLDYGIKTKTPLVIATTGITNENAEAIKMASEKIPIFQSANMSLGINVLINLVRKAATIFNESYDIEIIEKHHNKKIDSPSGTAYMIANAINEEFNNSKEFAFGREGTNERRTKNEIGIHAVRGGTIPGEHTVIYAGMDEIIEIKHTALSKKIFAQGAIEAARYIIGKDTGLYNMNDLICLSDE